MAKSIKKLFSSFKLLDIVALILVLVFSLILTLNYYRKSFLTPESVEISTRNGVTLIPLSKNTTYTVNGILGDTVIKVENGNVNILSSPCREKTCMSHGISKNGESLICLPNGVVVTLKSSQHTVEEANDALVSY